MRYDLAVIGGGLAGMTAAAALAAAGKRVVVLEQYSVVGGSTHVFRRKGKWEWQVGVHHVLDCGPNGDMPTAFRGLGLGDHISYQQMDSTGHERYMLPGMEFDTPADWDEFVHRIAGLFPEDASKLRRFFAVVDKTGASVDRVASTTTLSGTVRTAAKLGRHAPLATLSASAVMKRFGLSDRAQLLIAASPCGSLNCPPDRLPFIAMATFWHRSVRGGAWFPRGGAQVFTANLVRVVHHFGGDVVTDAFVEKILVEHGQARGVELRGGEVYLADTVISTADIKKTYQSLLPAEAVSARVAKRVARYRMSTPFFNAFLGADVDLSSLYPNRDYFVLPTWTSYGQVEAALGYHHDDTVNSWMDRVAPIVPAYVHCTDMKDRSRSYSPDGASSLEVMLPLPADYRLWGSEAVKSRNHDYARDSDQYAVVKEFLIDRMVERATTAFPELAGKIVHREAATALTQERFTQSSEGASYGIEWNLRQNGVLRPGARTQIDGLFLAGASCRTGPSTEGVLLSGLVTAGTILGRNLMSEFRRGQYLVPGDAIPAVADEWDPLREARPRARASSAPTPDLSAGVGSGANAE